MGLDAVLGLLGKLGQALLKIGPFIAAYVFGKRQARAEATEDALERSEKRHEVDDRVKRLDPDDLDRLL